jgi:hypothetical protein
MDSYGPIISNRGSFCFFENGDKSCLLPQVWKIILRQATFKNKLENRHKNFRAALYNKLGIPWSLTDFVGRSRFNGILNI